MISGLLSLCFINISFGPIFLIVWIIPIVAGLCILYTDGIELDFNKNRYRTIFSIFGISYGIWKSIPKIDYISIFKTAFSKTIGNIGFDGGAEATMSERVIKINLFAKNRKIITLFMTKNAETAIEIAESFKKFYGIDVVNKLDSNVF